MRSRRIFRILLADMPVKVICLTAAVILLLFHRINTLSERFFSVPLQVSVPAGLAVASSYPRSVRITLRGAEESIYPILEEDVEAAVSLDDRQSPGVFRAQVKVARKGTAQNVEPLEIKVEPQEIAFTLEPLAERRVGVVPDIRGAPAYGYELVQTAVTPAAVTIRGARSGVQGVASLPTEEIDLTGRTASFTAKVKLILPSTLVRVAGEASADFKATIQEALATRTFDSVEVAGLDLSPHFLLKAPPGPGSVQVRGAQLLVDGVRPDQVRLLLDFSIVKKAGRYTLHPRPETPEGVSVLDWSPREVAVEFVPSGK